MNIKEQYDKFGWVGPLPIMSLEDSLAARDKIVAADGKLNLMNSDYRCKSNVLFSWVDEISRNPTLVEYVSQLIGPNFHCWDTLFWIKYPGDNKNVSFHQDATYWNFDNKHKAVTAWFAFNDVVQEHGSMEYIQGSHQVFQRRHNDIKTSTNLLMRGQTVAGDISKERVRTSVPAGNILLHHPYIVHGSGFNTASTPRIAMGMVFVSTECKPISTISPESTVMISGSDEFNYMQHDPRPTGIWETDVANWQRSYDRQHLNYYKIEQQPND